MHAVWTTKNRLALLDEDDLAAIGATTQKTARKIGAVVYAAGGTEDHVHVLVRYRPDMAVSNLVRSMKASTSYILRQTIPEFAWQEGYAAFSVSTKDVRRVEAYILGQAAHHATNNTWDDCEPG
ncbi:MAG: IS200/IS605 family transposase [Proteobacteria bacterium]|jgi:putative transposase|nr:IS200/IS605 family transposase [Pseudomonadota bacterium]